MKPEEQTQTVTPENIKQCCAHLYESDVARLLLGDSFHPGGIKLTEKLGNLLQLTPQSRVLDVASGNGASAMFLAKRFGCQVLGIDFGSSNVEAARRNAEQQGLGGRAKFDCGDAESLPLPDSSFDAIICECSFCTFPDKAKVAREFFRVLRPGGRIGLSDLTRVPLLPPELNSLLAWISCIADAQPIDSYCAQLRSAGLVIDHVEAHDEALTELVRQIRGKLLAAEVMVGLKRLALPGVDFSAANRMAKAALKAIEEKQLGYAILCAAKPEATANARATTERIL